MRSCNKRTGVPFVVTVDFTHASDGHVTIRERDSCEQIRVPETEVPPLMAALDVDVTWQQAKLLRSLSCASAVPCSPGVTQLRCSQTESCTQHVCWPQAKERFPP